jgi:hypothetical protein
MNLLLGVWIHEVLAGGETMRLCSAPLAYYCRQSVVTRNDGTGPVILKFRAGPQQNVRIDSNHRYQFSRRITPLPTPGGTCTMSKSSSIARPESSSARGFCNTFTDSVAAAWFAMTICRYASSVRPRASACAKQAHLCFWWEFQRDCHPGLFP